MKAKALQLFTTSVKTGVGWLLLFILVMISCPLWAQQSQIPCNRDGATAFIPPTFGNLTEIHSTAGFGAVSWANTDRVIDNSSTNFARANLSIGVGLSATLRVTESVNTYSGGNFAGFLIKSSSLLNADLLGSITIRTYNNGTLAETSISGTLIGASSSLLSGAYEVGFITSSTKPFDAIEIEFASLASLGVANDVYYALQRSYCAGPTPNCNVKTSLVTSSTAATSAGYPAAINRVGSTGLSTFAINNPGSITDSDITNAATISLGVGVGSSAFVSVKDQVNKYNNAFAGFEISNNSTAGVKLLSNITITAYNSNTVVQSVSGSSLLAGVSLLNGNRQIIGFVPNGTFDEVGISFNSVLSADVSTTSIYRAVIERFCSTVTPVCKTLTPLTNPTYPVYIDNQHTGVDALACANCSITNAENVISGTATTPATIDLLTSVGSSARLSVSNAIDTYPAGTFAGFEISSGTLASINLAGSVRITLYNNGSAVQSGTGTSLLAGATVLSGTTSQTVGTVGQVPFDEIQIEFNQLASANPLGTISVYRALVQASCPTSLLACSQTIPLSRDATSAVIEGTRTGFSGLASINGSSVLNPWNVITPDATDYATITNLVSGGATGSISVADPATLYPAGVYAGFTIRKGAFLVSANLFSALTIETYRDGVLQETRAGNSLLDLSLLLPIFGSSSTTPYNVGFYTTKPFDEVRLSVGSLVNALAQSVDVYGAFVDTRSACTDRLNPDFSVTTRNVSVSGNVATNDNVSSGTTYGSPTASAANPAGATLTMNANGAYSFVATSAGSYTYVVPVCSSGQSTSCPTTVLLISVVDPTTTTNPPVLVPDYASIQSTTATPASLTINVRANDGPGNAGGTLGTPTVTVNPTHGTATISNGNLVYTPTAGYIGDDALTYQVCETPGGRCSTAQVVVHVTPVGSSTVSVVDDYASTLTNTAVSGNVLTNDRGNGLTVSNAGTITNAGGTLVLSSNGSYSFTPAVGVTGPTTFTYTACTNATPSVCGTATLHFLVVPPASVTVSGTVYNDSDGGTIDGTPTNIIAGNTLYVSIVNPGTGTVISTTAVQPNGTYSLTATVNASYSVVVSNAAQTVGTPVSNTGLTGAVSTAEGTTAGGDGLPNGATPITITTSPIAGVNFAIEQLPSAGSGSATVVNIGGSSAVTVPPSAFTSVSASTDTAPGSVTAIRITAFPSNTTSLTVNGSVYTSLPTGGIVVATTSSGAPTVAILVDPTNDSNPVSFSFVAIDNAGKESTTTGTAVLNSSLVLTLSGSVWNDADGNLALNGSETGTNAGGPLFVNLVSAANTILASTTVSSTGSYTLAGVPASTTGLKLVLTNTASSTAAGGLPGGWVNTGESVGSTNTATQSSVLGQIELSTTTVAVTAQNFGIEQVPSAGSGSVTVVNTGGSSGVAIPASAFTSTDTAPGSVTAIRISSFPANVSSLTINGSVYSVSSFPAGGVVVPTDGSGAPSGTILIDPTNDSSPVNLSFVAIDNAGKESTTSGTVVVNSSLVVSVSGSVWNDADGNLTLNGLETGTNAGGPLYVNLVNGSGALVASTSVNPNGSYTLSGVPASTTGLRLILTNTASSTGVGPLPGGWVNTGESVGSGNPATQSSVLGQIELSTTTVAVTAQNFGIEQLPSAGSGSVTVVNIGGSSAVTVPPSAFTSVSASTDTAPGSVTAIRLTAFPSNTTSLTVNGSVYSSLPAGGIVVATNSSGAPSVAILVDPTNDSNPVSFSFVAVDNAGKESTTTGTAVLNSSLVVSVSGSVWNDADGNLTLNGSETGTSAGGPLYVNLVSATNTVIASTTVSSTGSYTLAGVPASTTGLKLVLTNTASSTAAGGLPGGWVNTGESVGSGNPATQSSVLGQIELSTTTVAVTAQNFGIEQVPSAGSGTVTVVNTGGSSGVAIPASAFTSTDTAPGSVTAIRISSFPANVSSLTINGSVYSVSSFPAGGVVVPTDGSGGPSGTILIDPTNDSSPVNLSFVAIDNAGKESTTSGTVVVNSSLVLTVSGSVWNDADGNLALNGSETGTNAGGPLYVNLISASNTVIATGSVGTDGSYTLSGVPASTTGLKLVLTNSATSSAAGGLPVGWVNTGESVDGSNPATQSSVLGQIELTVGTVAIVAQNFGIEQLPTPGSGSASANNGGGNRPVTVPASAFTSVSASTDTAPGSVTAIRLTAFPSNTTSLTVNGSVYSSLPTGGILIPTDENGAPTVAISVNPTDDGSSVVMLFVAVDNAGKESATTGTATLRAVSDLTPIIYARPSTVRNTSAITVVVDVLELLNVASSGPITVRVSKDDLVNLTFDASASRIDNRDVQNSSWSFDGTSDPDYYIFRTTAVIDASDQLSFGLSGTLTPGATSGTLTVSAVIVGGSGGEVRLINNNDADKIDYFQR